MCWPKRRLSVPNVRDVSFHLCVDLNGCHILLAPLKRMLMVAQYKLRGGQEMKEDLSCDLLIPLKDVFVLIILLFEDFDQKSPVSFGSVLTVWALPFPSICSHLDQTKKKKKMLK